MILNDGEEWFPEDSDLIEWQRAYPNCDVFAEIAKMECWCEANPKNRKTARGIKSFVNKWLNKANSTGGSPMPMVDGDKPKLRQWTHEDDLTHNFTDSVTVGEMFLQKFGQYMTSDGRRVTREQQGEKEVERIIERADGRVVEEVTTLPLFES